MRVCACATGGENGGRDRDKEPPHARAQVCDLARTAPATAESAILWPLPPPTVAPRAALQPLAQLRRASRDGTCRPRPRPSAAPSMMPGGGGGGGSKGGAAYRKCNARVIYRVNICSTRLRGRTYSNAPEFSTYECRETCQEGRGAGLRHRECAVLREYRSLS